jgi:hypothetical protein
MAVADVSHLLRAWSDGDQLALDELTPIVYAELRRLTVRRDWIAKIWLYRGLTGESDDGLTSRETAR